MFLEEPGNGEVFLPINSSQTLTCSVTEDYIIVGVSVGVVIMAIPASAWFNIFSEQRCRARTSTEQFSD